MTTYVALLRGIGPGNPNMRNEKLRGVFEQLGMKNVRSVISSGNIIFDSIQTDTSRLEAMIEEAWPRELGFHSTTIIRSSDEIKQLLKDRTFADYADTADERLQITFTKRTNHRAALPYKDPDGWFAILAYKKGAVFSTYNSTNQKAARLMTWLEKQYGKEITTRTWKTVGRIARYFDQ